MLPLTTSERIAALAVFAATVLSSVAAGEDADGKKEAPSNTRIHELVSQLGADDFATREAAAKRLSKAGYRAFDALDVAKKSDDPEVRLRAELIEQQIVSRAVSEIENIYAKIGATLLENQRDAPQELYLSSKLVDDAVLVHVGCFRSLERLELRGSKIADDGLRHLRYLTKLRGIDLANTKITDTGLQHLMGMKRLVGISLEGCKISDTGLATIAELANLQALSFSGKQISDDGMVHLRRLKLLRHLTIQNVKLTAAGLQHLRPLGKQLERVRLLDMPLADKDLAPLRHLRTLRFLHFRGAKISGAGFEHLSRLSKLESLVLWNCQLHDTAIPSLAQLPALTNLTFFGNKFAPGGLQPLNGAPKLERVHFADGNEFSDSEYRAITEQFPEWVATGELSLYRKDSLHLNSRGQSP